KHDAPGAVAEGLAHLVPRQGRFDELPVRRHRTSVVNDPSSPAARYRGVSATTRPEGRVTPPGLKTAGPRRGPSSHDFGALRSLEVLPNLRCPEAAVAPQRADRGDLPRPGPAGHSLGIHAEQ